MHRTRHLKMIVRERFRWKAWEELIEARGLTIDRPRGTAHPDYPSIIYPVDYGYIPDTLSSDGEAVDVFRGTAENTGLVGLILSHDHRQKDCEAKLLYDCSPREIYMIHGFINFDRSLLEGVLILRYPMQKYW